MKNLTYYLFAFLFNICRILPVRENRVVFLAPHKGGENDALHILARRMQQEEKYEICFVNPRLATSSVRALFKFFFRDTALLAGAKKIYLNDNFMPLAFMHFSKKTEIIQLWHAEGAFKKFGLDLELDKNTKNIMIKSGRKITRVICSSPGLIPVYASAFGVDESRVNAEKSLRAQSLLGKDAGKARKMLEEKYPQIRGKKAVLYAPTFRDNKQDDEKLLEKTDGAEFDETLGQEYVLLIKLHPQVHGASVPGNVIDVTGEDIEELTLACDILVTDYSSVCMDFALLGKKCIFFAFDKEKYAKERSFYFDYDSYVPGPICDSFGQVLENIPGEPDRESLRKFVEFNFAI